MNVGEIIVKFGAEITGFQLGIKGVLAGLASITTGASEIAFGLQNLGTAGTIGMDALGQGAARAGSGFLMLGGLVAAVGVAIAVALGVKAVQAAGDFQQGLNRLVTGAGDVTDNMGRMGAGILATSVATGILTSGTAGLNAAMYLVISSQQRGAQALDTLKVAAMGAVSEQANVVDVVKALTTAMTDYGTSQFNATQFMNGYIKAVQLSRLSLEQLSTSMGPILPMAKNLGISFADVAGAMATMTNAGISANVAATSLRFLLQSLENPTTKAKDAMTALGLSSVAVGNEMKVSLPGALEMIYKAALRAGPEGSVPFNRAMSDMVGGQRSLQAMLSLTGSHFSTFVADSRAVASAMNGGKSAVLGWDTAQSNFNVKMSQAHAAVAALGIVVGSQLLPFLSQIVGMVLPLVASFTQWVIQSNIVENGMHMLVGALQSLIAIGSSVVAFFRNNEIAMSALKGVLITVAGIIAVTMVTAMYAWAAAAWTAAAGMIAATWPILAVAAAVAVLVAAFIYFYNTSTGFRSVIDTIVGALKQAFAAVVQFGSYLIGQIGPALTTVGGFFRQLWAVIQQGAAYVAQLASSIGAVLLPFIRSLWAVLQAQFLPVWQQLLASWQQTQPVLAQLSGVFRMLWTTVQQLAAVFMSMLMPTLKSTAAALQALWSVVSPQIIPALKLMGEIIGGVLLISLGLLVGMLTGVTGALAGFLSGAIQVVQGVTQVFTGLSQFLTGIVAFITDLFTGHFERLSADLGMIWQGILNIIQGTMTAMVGIFNVTFGVILGFVSGFANGVIAFFTTLYHTLVGGSIVPDMCAGILSAFTGMISSVLSAVAGFIASAIGLFASLAASVMGLVNGIAASILSAFQSAEAGAIGAVQALAAGVASALSGLGGMAAAAGNAIISGLVGAINAGVGWVSSAINNLVSTIDNLLPHSPAKEGPLRNLNKYGPALTHGIAQGITAGIPEVAAAVNLMVQPAAAPPSSGMDTLGSSARRSSPARGGSAAPDTRALIIQFHEREIVRALMPAVQQELMVHFGGR